MVIVNSVPMAIGSTIKADSRFTTDDSLRTLEQ